MKTIKFVSKDKRQFSIALRKNVNSYFKERGISPKGDLNMYLKAFLMIALYLIPFIMLLAVPMNIWVAILFVSLMGIGMAGIGMSVMHDAAHGSFSGKKWVNDLLSKTIYMLGGNLFNWKLQHNIFHHTFTNIEGLDEDIQSRVVIRLSQHTPLRKIHRFQHFYSFFFYSLMTVSKLVRDFIQLRQYNKSGITQQYGANPNVEYLKMIGIKAVYLFVIIGLPTLLTPFGIWQVLTGFLLMHMIAGIIMSIVFQMAHVVEGTEQPIPDPEGNIENEWAIHQLYTTANFSTYNPFLRWLIGGLNFQIEHHLLPHVCHIHYPKIAPIVKKTAQEFGLPYHQNPSFSRAVLSHIKTLKILGRKEGQLIK